MSRRVSGYRPVARDRVLSNDELRLIWSEQHNNGRMIRFLVLTGLRISEAEKGHQDGYRWTVPAKISKNKRPLWVYLTETAKAQLRLAVTAPQAPEHPRGHAHGLARRSPSAHARRSSLQSLAPAAYAVTPSRTGLAVTLPPIGAQVRRLVPLRAASATSKLYEDLAKAMRCSERTAVKILKSMRRAAKRRTRRRTHTG